MSSANTNDSAAEKVERSIVAAHDGSYSALGQLLDHYRDYLLRVANDELQSDLAVKVAPSDLVQETFLQAARGFPTFKGQTEAELRGWLRRILINRLRDANRHFFRRRRRAVSQAGPLEKEDEHLCSDQRLESTRAILGAELIEAETAALVCAAIAKLPEAYRQVIELRHFEHQTLPQIGVVMDRSPEAVRKLWCRAVEKLICELSRHRSGGP